jgi:hypothetical protein
MLLCHIVGLNNTIKPKFIDFCEQLALKTSRKIIIEDIDYISKSIMDNVAYTKLLDSYYSPESIGKRREILHHMSTIWKNTMTKELSNIMKINNGNIIILLGLSNYVMDQRVKIDVPTKNLFFINIDPELNAKQIIAHNIDHFKEQIINGNFPLNYLELTFLKDQREVLRDLYAVKGYSLKHYDAVIRWISNKMSPLDVEKVFIASFKRYDDQMEIDDNVIGYTTKWLAMISLFPKSSIKRGILYGQNNIMTPHIVELHPNIFNSLKRPCYVYEFVPYKKIDSFRYVIDKNNKTFETREYISDVYDDLIRLGAKLERYKIICSESQIDIRSDLSILNRFDNDNLFN